MIVEYVYNDVVVETTLTVLAAYTSWCLAEFSKSSGVLAVVATGLSMSHSRGLVFTEKGELCFFDDLFCFLQPSNILYYSQVQSILHMLSHHLFISNWYTVCGTLLVSLFELF
jgi:hypothetical protein